MNYKIIQKEVQDYLKKNQDVDFRKISLQKSPFEGISSAELAQQIKGMQVAKSKFPFLYENEAVMYPPTLNMEQASSWATSKYKSKLIEGKKLIDLTAGMGIDAYGFAQNFEKVTALERNPELAEISKYNFETLQQSNLTFVCTDFEVFLKENPNSQWDVLYLDPARRKNSQKKFILEDLEPNVLEWMDEFLRRSQVVLIKLSPLLDLQKLVDEIPQIHQVYLVAVKNEAKELLLICKKEICSNPEIKAVNLESEQPEFSFLFSQEKSAEATFTPPQKFLYEPNSVVLKSGAFKLVSQKFDLGKLHPNTHLYTSDLYMKSFPGKVYEIIEEVLDPKFQLKNHAFHVISKNYPLSVEEIRKKYKLKESELQSLIFTQSIVNKHILLCRKLA